MWIYIINNWSIAGLLSVWPPTVPSVLSVHFDMRLNEEKKPIRTSFLIECMLAHIQSYIQLIQKSITFCAFITKVWENVKESCFYSSETPIRDNTSTFLTFKLLLRDIHIKQWTVYSRLVHICVVPQITSFSHLSNQFFCNYLYNSIRILLKSDLKVINNFKTKLFFHLKKLTNFKVWFKAISQNFELNHGLGPHLFKSALYSQ